MLPQTFTVAFHDWIPIRHLDGIKVDQIHFKLDFDEIYCNFQLEIGSSPQYIEVIRPQKQSIDIARPLKMDIDSYFYTETHFGNIEDYVQFNAKQKSAEGFSMTPRVLNIFFQELRTLTYNNYFGLFLSQRTKIVDSHAASAMKQCCVCYEMTTRRTSCNHQLCIRCLMSLTHGQEKCPYCRQSFVIRQHQGVKIISDL